MANLNPEKLAENLTKVVENVIQAQRIAADNAIFNFKADFIDRVFQDGKDNDEAPIGQYSTKPFYYSLASKTSQFKASALKAKGKNSKKSKFANGKERKSQYFPGGYKEFRDTAGRFSDKVDLFLTGSMRGDIGLDSSDPQALKVGFATDLQAAKARGNEKHFNKTIFAPSENELDNISDKYFDATSEAFFKSFE